MKKVIIILSCIAIVGAAGIGAVVLTIKNNKTTDERENVVWNLNDFEDETQPTQKETQTIVDDEGNVLVVVQVPESVANNISAEESNESKIDKGNFYSSTQKQENTTNSEKNTGYQIIMETKEYTRNDTVTYTARSGSSTEFQVGTWQTLSPTNAYATSDKATVKNTTVAAQDGTYNGFTYHRQSDGNVEITGYSGGSSVNIPSSINGYAVTSIATGAFFGKGITSITIPNTVRSIGGCAFAGNCGDGSLSVSIPSSVTYIGGGAFAGINVTNVSNGYTLDAGCIYYGSRLVSASGLNGVGYNGTPRRYDVKAGTTAIDEYAFRGCSQLTFITLPDSLRSIGIGAFYGCSNMGEFTIPAGVSYIEAYTFRECSRLGTVHYMYVTQEVIDSKEAIYNTSAFESYTAVLAANGTRIK